MGRGLDTDIAQGHLIHDRAQDRPVWTTAIRNLLTTTVTEVDTLLPRRDTLPHHHHRYTRFRNQSTPRARYREIVN